MNKGDKQAALKAMTQVIAVDPTSPEAAAGEDRHRTAQDNGRSAEPVARPFRFTFILISRRAGTGLAAVGGWRYARASAPVSGPIILISIDTLRADHLPAYGYRKVKTPAIDALAADGVVFERAYSHAPQTLPAHASLLSGRLPFETGVRDNVGFAREGRRAAAAADAARARLRDRRRRLGVRAAQGNRHQPGIRFLRRRDAAGLAASWRSARCSATAPSRKRSPSTGSTASARRARSCSCTSTSRTSRTRRRTGSPSTRRTTARSPTPTRSSAGWFGT